MEQLTSMQLDNASKFENKDKKLRKLKTQLHDPQFREDRENITSKINELEKSINYVTALSGPLCREIRNVAYKQAK